MKTKSVVKEIAEFINENYPRQNDGSGIVYCLSRRKSLKICLFFSFLTLLF